MLKKNNHRPLSKSLFLKETRAIRREIDSSVEKLDSSDKKLDKKIDSSVKELNRKIDNVAISLVKTQSDVEEIKITLKTEVATKADINVILNRIDHFGKKVDVFEKKVLVHDYPFFFKKW